VSRALVLNASYEPLCVVAARRALVLVLDDKAELVSATDREYHSARAAFPEPSVVRLVTYVRVPYRTRVALNRRAIFLRDGHRCQYCGAAAENIDHVVPRSRGGRHAWDNVVAACRPCNSHKEDRLLSEVTTMRLRRPPTAPTGRIWMLVAMGGLQPEWRPYLRLPAGVDDLVAGLTA
jgi:5-methylcytosine-specific restriction endonuclease McrA